MIERHLLPHWQDLGEIWWITNHACEETYIWAHFPHVLVINNTHFTEFKKPIRKKERKRNINTVKGHKAMNR